MENIPLIDIRNGSLIQVAEQYVDKTLSVLNASRDAFGIVSRIASHVALPVGDKISRDWLEKTKNPYLAEIHAYAELSPVRGIYALNLSYEWGCTSGAYRSDDNIMLTRVLDWPFPALGKNIVIAHQQGQAGEFYNVTWPGLSGVFQAMAPKRFAVALNQAPMRRYRTGIVIDWLRNRSRFNKQTSLPPAHLLRKVLEMAPDYHTAKTMLAEEPVSLPVIYILSGTQENEGCVIERLENRSCIRSIGTDDNVCAANHFESNLNGVGHGWLPRAIDSDDRAAHACALSNVSVNDGFEWFKPPIANPLSRLVMVADAAKGKLAVMGTEGETPVTKPFIL